jgi:hypothetical protein
MTKRGLESKRQSDEGRSSMLTSASDLGRQVEVTPYDKLSVTATKYLQNQQGFSN